MKPSEFTLCGFTTILSLWPMVDVVTKHCDPKLRLYHPKGFTETLNRVEAQIARLRWCEETCFAHQAWARFDFNTTNPVVLKRRIEQTQAKLARIAARYRPNDT